MLEQLESRRLLSVLLDRDRLIIRGTDGDDDIRLYVRSFGFRVNVNGDVRDFDLDRVESAVISGFGGDDEVIIDANLKTTIDGGEGEDTIRGGSRNDKIIGGPHDDDLSGRRGNDKILGGLGDDEISGGDGRDKIYGEDGHDEIRGGDGDDVLKGGRGNDTLDGGLGADLFYGNSGADTASYAQRTEDLNLSLDGVANDGVPGRGTGLPGDQAEGDNLRTDVESIVGGEGDDFIIGSVKKNRLMGGKGDDTLIGGLGRDLFFGGSGKDAVSYADRTEALVLTADGKSRDGAADERDNIGIDVEVLIGGLGNDYIAGGDANNELYGRSGNDTLVGGKGTDLLIGDEGDDLLSAIDDYADTLLGGLGQDTGRKDAKDQVSSDIEKTS